MRARAFLYGADPDKQGSSFYGINLDRRSFEHEIKHSDILLNYALDYYIETVQIGAKVCPVPKVMTHLIKLAKTRSVDLTGYSKKMREVNKIKAQIERRQNEIANLKRQTTKKAKRKVQHLEDAQVEAREKIKRLNRRIKSA